jgi:hypothetical protein
MDKPRKRTSIDQMRTGWGEITQAQDLPDALPGIAKVSVGGARWGLSKLTKISNKAVRYSERGLIAITDKAKKEGHISEDTAGPIVDVGKFLIPCILAPIALFGMIDADDTEGPSDEA